MRILVTGAGGGLGRAFLSVAPSHHDVHAFAHEELDVGDHHVVMQSVVQVRPDAILNFAAFTNVDGCELDPDRAYRDNAIGAQNVALAARAAGAMLLHISTDYVFNGEKGSPYDELDRPAPLSVYARSKLAGEAFVRHLVAEHFVVRTAWLFGSGTDRVTAGLARLERREAIGAVADRVGSPTYVPHLAARLLPLLLTGRFGTYHIAGPEPATWFDLFSRLWSLGGLAGEVRPQRTVDLGLPAPRPRNSSLVSLFAGEAGVPAMPPLDAALKELLDSR